MAVRRACGCDAGGGSRAGPSRQQGMASLRERRRGARRAGLLIDRAPYYYDMMMPRGSSIGARAHESASIICRIRVNYESASIATKFIL